MKVAQIDNISDKEELKASIGWLNNFTGRNHLSLRRKTSVAKKIHIVWLPRLSPTYYMLDGCSQEIRTAHAISLRWMRRQFGTIWYPKPLSIQQGKKLTLKTTGHEKSRVSVCLAAKPDGTKLKPMIVFKGAKREVEALH